MPTPIPHVLCSACGHMGCEHLAAELRYWRALAEAQTKRLGTAAGEIEGLRHDLEAVHVVLSEVRADLARIRKLAAEPKRR